MLLYYTEHMTQETEIKIAIGNLKDAVERIERAGFSVAKPRVFERNLVFDTSARELGRTRRLLRLRDAGGHVVLTFKGPPVDGAKHKSREERETGLADFAEMQTILERLGYLVTFVYEKYRAEFTKPGADGSITLDETPIGNFLELEGEPEWIDRTAKELGFAEKDYVTASYGGLYAEWCRQRGVEPGHMRFGTAADGVVP